MTGRELAGRYFDAQTWLASFEDMVFASGMGHRVNDRLHARMREAGLYG